MRGGGHSYEGFSQSETLVLDTRPMSTVKVDVRGRTVSVGGGAELGKVTTAVGSHDLAMAGGSCPTVGVAGNTLGGGYGFLAARRFGLSCDSLMAVEMVDAAGRILTADAATNSDLLVDLPRRRRRQLRRGDALRHQVPQGRAGDGVRRALAIPSPTRTRSREGVAGLVRRARPTS